jgi:methyl-accepting chemotaxis protein
VKSIKARIVAIVVIVNLIGGGIIMAGMNMAYTRNVELVKQASGEVAEQEEIQQQLFEDMAGNRNRAIAMAAILAIVMSVALLTALNSLLFKRIRKVIHDAMGVIGGRYDTPITVVRDDEMGEIETALEQFRILFIDAVSQAKEAGGE